MLPATGTVLAFQPQSTRARIRATGDPFGLRIAAMMNENIVNPETGDSSPVLLDSPNADETNSLRMTRSLSNLLTVSAEDPFVRGDMLKAIEFDSQGNAWFASQGDDQVYAFRSNGNKIGAFNGGGIDGPWGLTVDGEDNIWVANFGPTRPDVHRRGGISKLAGANADTAWGAGFLSAGMLMRF